MIKGKPLYLCAKAFFMTLLEHFLLHPSISTDTRTVKKGDIFFALKGENFDGNKYAHLALEKGASLVVIDDENALFPVEKTHRVGNVLLTLQDLARAYRQSFDLPVLAITGSNGKTTTKELIAAVISKKFKPLVTAGNLNNHIGVPLTLLSAKRSNDLFIIEMGANHKGEIEMLCEIAMPNLGMITNIGKAHLEGFGGIEGVKIGKSELYKYLAKNNGTILCNALDETLIGLLPEKSTVKEYDTLSRIVPNFEGEKLSFSYNGSSVNSHLFGEYNLPNIAAAIAVGEYFEIPLNEILDAIASYIPGNNRSEILKVGTNTIIKDAYNANPSSLMASLKSFIDEGRMQNQIVIIGDMLELGNDSKIEHERILHFLSQYNLFKKIFIGPTFYSLKENYVGDFYLNTQLAGENVVLSDLNDKHILLKGSRGIAVEKILSK